jgi:hypothetical protein
MEPSIPTLPFTPPPNAQNRRVAVVSLSPHCRVRGARPSGRRAPRVAWPSLRWRVAGAIRRNRRNLALRHCELRAVASRGGDSACRLGLQHRFDAQRLGYPADRRAEFRIAAIHAARVEIEPGRFRPLSPTARPFDRVAGHVGGEAGAILALGDALCRAGRRLPRGKAGAQLAILRSAHGEAGRTGDGGEALGLQQAGAIGRHPQRIGGTGTEAATGGKADRVASSRRRLQLHLLSVGHASRQRQHRNRPHHHRSLHGAPLIATFGAWHWHATPPGAKRSHLTASE